MSDGNEYEQVPLELEAFQLRSRTGYDVGYKVIAKEVAWADPRYLIIQLKTMLAFLEAIE